MKRSPKAAAPALARASKRANALIEAMLKEMQMGLKDPERLDSPDWARLFGAKQSMVVNLQKLVQALASLPLEPPKVDRAMDVNQEAPLSKEEMGLLTQWLADREV